MKVFAMLKTKEQFIKEAWRLLKPGGRLVVADGFVSEYEYNEDSTIRRWLDGWQVNYLESPQRFEQFMPGTGFRSVQPGYFKRSCPFFTQALPVLLSRFFIPLVEKI